MNSHWLGSNKAVVVRQATAAGEEKPMRTLRSWQNVELRQRKLDLRPPAAWRTADACSAQIRYDSRNTLRDMLRACRRIESYDTSQSMWAKWPSAQ